MTNDDRTLRDVAQLVLDKHGVSGRQLDAMARNRGLTISYTTINAMAAGTYRSTPSDKTLDALVALSGLESHDVYAAAGRPLPMAPLAQRLPADSDSLTREQQEVVLSVVRQFAKANRSLAQARREDVGNDERSAPITETGNDPASNVQVGPWGGSPDEESRPIAAHPVKGRESRGRQKRRQLDQVGEESQDPGE